MSGLARKTALFAVAAVLAFSGAAGSVLGDSSGHHDSGHHEHWTHKQCTNQLGQWKKAHKHPTAKQTNQENKLLKKHDCNERV
jgi:hypothetical protein